VAVFRRFLLKQHSEENLDFFIEVERLHQAPSEGLSAICLSIYNTFVKAESKSQVNLTSPALKEVDGRIDHQQYTNELFDRCQNEALNLLRVNFWSEFRKSEDFLAASRGDFTLLDENGPEKKRAGSLKSSLEPSAAAATATAAARASPAPQPSQLSSQSTPGKAKKEFKFSALFSKSKSTPSLQNSNKRKSDKGKTKH